jgi:hypothetical protein
MRKLPIDLGDVELLEAATALLTARFRFGRHHVAAAVRQLWSPRETLLLRRPLSTELIRSMRLGHRQFIAANGGVSCLLTGGIACSLTPSGRQARTRLRRAYQSICHTQAYG